VPGQRVCVYGATGAIGSAAVQLLVAEGSEVTAFCRVEHADVVRGLGASTVLDHTTQDLATYPERFDLVFDAVGKSTFAAARPLLADRGQELIRRYERTGVRLATVVSAEDDLSTADGRMVARIKASMDAAEAERISERTPAGQPMTGGGRPFGYAPDQQMTALETTGILARQNFHGEWNYTIHPGTAQPTRSQHSDTPETN
jgi:D-arabinose 1-dehydrogenase-like Zn-dependent alcohol dehydrogenase